MITIKPLKGSYVKGYQVEGHADFAEHGMDIVCSAISVLSQSCLISLQRYGKVEWYMESGLLTVDVPVPSSYTNLLINSMVLGMSAVAKNYPEHVYIERENHTQKGTNLHDENARI